MENLDFILSLFNQFVYNDAKNNIESLEYYVSVNPAISGNTLINSLLGAIKNYSFDSIDLPLFQSILMKDHKTPQEQQQIVNELIKWKNFNKSQMAPTKKYLSDIIAGSIISKANSKFANDPMGYLNYLKQANIKIDKSDALSSQSFDTIDINSMIAEGFGKGFPSHFDWINALFDPGNQYECGQLGIISCPPGVGKSLWMMTEAASMALNCPDAKILYLAMGDLKLRDFVVRMGALTSGLSFADAARNLRSVYSTLKQNMGDRLHVSINPAGSVDPDEFVEYVLSNGYNVVFADYDSNFKIKSSENMYNDFGAIYNGLTRLTQKDILCFVACQPNKLAWKNEEINMEDLGESARKPHYADFIFTASKLQGPNHCGIFKCCKNRRGEEGDTTGYIRLANGRFKFIPIDLAKQISGQPKTKYLDSDIDQMMAMYNQNLQAINSFSPQGGQSMGKISNPFKKP